MKSFWGDNPFPSSSDLLLGSFLPSDLWLALSRPMLTPAAEAGQQLLSCDGVSRFHQETGEQGVYLKMSLQNQTEGPLQSGSASPMEKAVP